MPKEVTVAELYPKERSQLAKDKENAEPGKVDDHFVHCTEEKHKKIEISEVD